MFKRLPFIIYTLSFLIFAGACVKKPSRNETETALIEAMSKYLNSDPKRDTSKIKFTVMNVTYFEEAKVYACEFKVKMKTAQKDTTGIMTAYINKDFGHIIRKN